MEAYRVPFDVRRGPDEVRLMNRSGSELRWVRFFAHGVGVAVSRPIPKLLPGASVVVRVKSPELAKDTLLVIQWTRPDGEIYLASIAL